MSFCMPAADHPEPQARPERAPGGLVEFGDGGGRYGVRVEEAGKERRVDAPVAGAEREDRLEEGVED